MPAEYLLKVCILGFPGELKTDWVRRYAEGKFTTDYLPTLGVDITTKQIHVSCNNIKLILVDTANQEFFGKLRPSYYRGASAAIITFDKGDRDSFKAVKKHYNEFKKYIPQGLIPITLVG
ncbi:MAG: Rab family GTPase, partial [Promethearchaeota archaeon]